METIHFISLKTQWLEELFMIITSICQISGPLLASHSLKELPMYLQNDMDERVLSITSISQHFIQQTCCTKAKSPHTPFIPSITFPTKSWLPNVQYRKMKSQQWRKRAARESFLWTWIEERSKSWVPLLLQVPRTTCTKMTKLSVEQCVWKGPDSSSNYLWWAASICTHDTYRASNLSLLPVLWN